jgi:hypothetical protein
MDLRGRGTEDKELRKVCGGVGERDKEDNFGPTTSGLLSSVCVGGGFTLSSFAILTVKHDSLIEFKHLLTSLIRLVWPMNILYIDEKLKTVGSGYALHVVG